MTLLALEIRGNRLLVKCDAPATGADGVAVWYFAIHIGQNLERARLALGMLTAARIAGRQVRITYYSDETSNTGWDMGCDPKDCRPIVALELL